MINGRTRLCYNSARLCLWHLFARVISEQNMATKDRRLFIEFILCFFLITLIAEPFSQILSESEKKLLLLDFIRILLAGDLISACYF